VRSLIQRRRPGAVFVERFIDPDESFRMEERQWSQKRALDDGKNGSVCAYTQRENRNRNGRERWGFNQHP